jgi:4'-phosphopantetheinyl transferase
MFPRNEIHVWRADISGMERWPQSVMSALSEEERARHARFLQERDARRFALGRAMLRVALGRRLGVPPQSLRFESGPFGKPRLAPEREAPFRFNVAHSGDVVLVAVALDREVGIDVEAIRPIDDLDSLVRATFSEREQRGISAAPDRLASFFATWTRKEAVVKALGQGLSFPLDAFDVDVNPLSPPALLHSRDAALRVGDWMMHGLPQTPGYASALAAERATSSVVVFEECASTIFE